MKQKSIHALRTMRFHNTTKDESQNNFFKSNKKDMERDMVKLAQLCNFK